MMMMMIMWSELEWTEVLVREVMDVGWSKVFLMFESFWCWSLSSVGVFLMEAEARNVLLLLLLLLLLPAVSRKICIGSWWGGGLKMMTQWQPLQCFVYDLCHLSWPWQIACVLGVMLTFHSKVISTSKDNFLLKPLLWLEATILNQDSGHLHTDRVLFCHKADSQ